MGVVSLAVSATRSLKDVVFHACSVVLHILHLDGMLALGHSPGNDMAKLSTNASELEGEPKEDDFQVIWAENVTPEASSEEEDEPEEVATPIEKKPRHRVEDNLQGEVLTSEETAANMHTDSIVSPKVFKQQEATTIPPEDASPPAKAMSAKPIDMGDEEALSFILGQDASVLSNPTEAARFPSLESVEEEPYDVSDEQEPQPEERYAAKFTNNSRSLSEKPPASSAMDFGEKLQQPQTDWSDDEDDDVKSIHDIQEAAYTAPPFMPHIGTVVMSPRVERMLPLASSSSPASHSLTLSPQPQTPKRRTFFSRKH